jgi:hypothetical protein
MRRVIVPENKTAARLAVYGITHPLQCLADFCPGDRKQSVQTHTSTIPSSMDGGISSLCFLELSKYALMAS